jgi:hypothetical protein
MALAVSLQESIPRSHRKVIPQVQVSDHFPYREQDGKSL